MTGVHKDKRSGASHRRRISPIVVVAGLALAMTIGGGQAIAMKMSGSKRGETITGTKGADKITGKGGDDKLKGAGGNDAVSGGKGRDRIVGGKGADRHLGGAGADVLKAADGRRDRAINGGPGIDRCIVDTARELSIVRGCEAVSAGPATAGGPNGPLSLVSATGIVCDTPLPNCAFTLNVSGLDGLVATITGSAGIVGLNADVNTLGTDGILAGNYGCIADGFLQVTVGSQIIDVPIDCTV
jgi:hypothetical protein